MNTGSKNGKAINIEMIKLKRVYETPDKNDGLRILVERLWPRGMTKEKAKIDHWLKDAAPSPELRKWYQHDVEKWPEFQQKYREELAANTGSLKEFLDLIKDQTVTFVFAAKDEEHNSAVLLKQYLEGIPE